MNKYAIQKVLVPIDFSPVSFNALNTAIAICQRQLSTLTLIHIVENSFLANTIVAKAESGGALAEIAAIANENLTNLARELRLKHDLIINHLVQIGNPSDEICHWIISKDIGLVVMGSNGSSGFRKFILGSTAYRVVRHSSCPVLTVPYENHSISFKKILFPVRMVANALDKYDVIRPIIQKNDSSLLIAGIVKKNESARFVEMKDLVDTVREKITEDNIECGSEVHYCEDVAEQVLAISNNENPDLIVITATLDSTLRELFPGTYTQKIVNDSKFPVLSIKAETLAEQGVP